MDAVSVKSVPNHTVLRASLVWSLSINRDIGYEGYCWGAGRLEEVTDTACTVAQLP